MNFQKSALFLMVCLSGCVTTSLVSTPEQYPEINTLGQENQAMITLNSDSAGSSADGGRITLTRDSVQWFDPQSYQRQSALTANLQRIRFISRGSGAIEGAVVGVIPGALFFSLVVITSSINGRTEFTDDYMIISAAVAGSGALIGSIVGALIGHKIDYVFRELPGQKITAPNTAYLEIGTLLLFPQGSLSVNYERTVLPHLVLRAGVGTCWSDGNPNRIRIQVMANYLFGDDDSKFEIGAGLSGGANHLDALGMSSIFAPAISIGYRYQPVNGGLMFRMGGAWTYAYGFPFQLSLGYAF